VFSDIELETVILLCQRQQETAAFRRVSSEFLERVAAVEAIAIHEQEHRQQEKERQKFLDQ
jgi:Na+-transporting methylmalonyl-CoA/oxaloacetate decarboxylase gamma subunit